MFSVFSFLALVWADPLPFTAATPLGSGEGVDGIDMAACRRVLTPDISLFTECSGPRQRSGSRVAPFAPEICYVGLRDDNGSGRINKAHRIEDAKKQEASGKILCLNRIDWKEMCCWQKEGVKVGLLGS
jgi:hypothetical protein